MEMQLNTANELASRIARSSRPELLAYAVWMCTESPQIAMMMTVAIMVMIGLSLILDYLQKKRQIESAAELSMAQQTTYRFMLEISARKPGAAAVLRPLILADALRVAVERNGVQPADQTHRHLYDGNSPETTQPGCEPGVSNSPDSCPPLPPVEKLPTSNVTESWALSH